MSSSDFLLSEYEKLKDEQLKRIAFRDQMIYISLGAIGSVFSFAVENPKYFIALLILPFITLVLGWTYLVNDEKISSIGKYLKLILIPKINNQKSHKHIESWETYLKKDKKRKLRKGIQLIVDLTVFCVSSIASVTSFFFLENDFSIGYIILSIVILIAVIMLMFQFIKYSN